MKTQQCGSHKTELVVSDANIPQKKKSICLLHWKALKCKRCMEACRTSWLFFVEVQRWADTAAQALVLEEGKGMQEEGDCPF